MEHQLMCKGDLREEDETLKIKKDAVKTKMNAEEFDLEIMKHLKNSELYQKKIMVIIL
jgi:hypothetical protein